MRDRHWLPALVLVLQIIACSTIPGFPELTPTAGALATATSAAPVPLTAEQVMSAEYILIAPDGSEHAYRFTDGAYESGTDPLAADYASIHIVAIQPDQRVVFGDLNDDGAQDAAVLIAENYGGSGVFVSVAAVLNEQGRPRHAASYGIDDRPEIHALEIRGDEIFLDATIHGLQDPGCCPAMPVTRSFRLVGRQLMLVGASSRTPGGAERLILIDSPADGAEVTGAFQLRGSVTIAPFENTLGYSLSHADGSELVQGSVMVTAAEPGGPGTFDATIDLTGVPPGPVWLTLADFSAADGSVLALDSVRLVIR